MSQFAKDFNPFANIDLHIPIAFREEVKEYTTTQGGGGDTSEESAPFIRYVDLWMTAVAVGAEEDVFVPGFERHRFIQGSVLQGEVARIEFLQLVAIAHTEDPFVVKDSRKVVEIAEGYAAGGLPVVLEWLSSGRRPPLENLTKYTVKFLEDAHAKAQ